MLTPCLISDCAHVRRADAQDLAEAIVATIPSTGRICVYVTPDGHIGYEFFRDGAVTGLGSLSLIGCYDERTTAAQIRDDILAQGSDRIFDFSPAGVQA